MRYRHTLAAWIALGAVLGGAAPGRAAYAPRKHTLAYQVVLWRNGQPDTARLVTGQYAGLDAKGRRRHPECAVQVAEANKPNGTHWTISVKPTGDWGVAEVRHPMLLFPRLKRDFLITSNRTGERIPMARVTRRGERPPGWAFRAECRGYPDLQNKQCLYWNRYPLGINMQLLMYEDDRQGCMIWTPDAGPYTKDFIVSYGPENSYKGLGYLFYIAHFPENTGQKGTGFASPYPVVTTPYQDGWYQAAQVYRQWAEKQWWCAKGKLYDRPDTPAWVKDIHAWFGTAGRPDWVMKWLKKYVAVLKGRRAGGQLSNWSHYFGPSVTSPRYMPAYQPKRFLRNLAMRKQKLHLAPYFMFSNAAGLDQDVVRQVRRGFRLDAYGRVATRYWSGVDHALIFKWL